MSSVSIKGRQPSRLLSCLIVFSTFLLVSSLLLLMECTHNPLIPKSVFDFVGSDNSSFELTTYGRGGVQKPGSPIFQNKILGKEDVGDIELDLQGSDSRKIRDDQGVTLRLGSCDEQRAHLRVYMYDMPPKFHFGLLGWKESGNQTWPSVSDPKRIPSYPGGLNLQHSMEYWLTLDLLASGTANVVCPCSAIRVGNSSEADVVFVPFFSSLSLNRHSKIRGNQRVSVDRLLQEQLVEFLKDQREWKQLNGRNHLIAAHHPNSMLYAREKLGSAMFVLSDFGRYPVEIANIGKDVIAPYRHMVRTILAAKSAPFDKRQILAYFQGAIYRKDGGVIRQELYYLLKDEEDVHFSFGSVQANGINQAGRGMASSKFCLNIAGDTPSSNRLFDAIASLCVPVIISDDIELPFEDVLDYSEFCIFVSSSAAVKKGYLLNLLRGIKQEKWTEMWERLKEVSRHFEYQYPSQPNDAVDMIWQTVLRKRESTQLNVHRKNRYSRSWFP